MGSTDSIRLHVPRRFARGALVYFVLVGLIGVLLRARYVAHVLPSLRFDNLVHAHSHVAYFGWASLALMAAIYKILPRLTGRTLRGARVMRLQLVLTHVVTLGALVTFATGGYTPLSIVFSTLNVLLWYVFIWLYWQNVRGLPGPLPVPLRYFHGAVVLLFLSSLGTWLISVVSARGGSVVGQQAGLNIFLTNFTDGWLLLGLLGLGAVFVPGRGVRERRGPRSGDPTQNAMDGQWAAGPLPWIVGLTPLTFLAELVPFDVAAGALVLGLAARFGLAVPYVWFIWNAIAVYRAVGLRGYGGRAEATAHAGPGVEPPRALRALVVLAFAFFVAKAVIHAGLGLAAVVPARQMFVAYLHLDLLGFVSCGLLAALYFVFNDHRVVAAASRSRGFDAGVVGAAVLTLGLVAMVAALAIVGVIGGTTDSVTRAVVNGLLEATFVFALVALVGIVLSVAGLWQHVRRAALDDRR